MKKYQMSLIESIDGVNRLIYLSSDTVNSTVNPIDIYKEMRTLRRNDEDLRKFDLFLSAFGNVSKGNNKATERYVVCNLGTRIVPYDSQGFLTINGVIITDDEQEGVDCFSRDGLNSRVDINYVPPQVEVIRVESSGGLTPEQEAILNKIIDILEGDVIPLEERFSILHKLTKSVLVQKDVTEQNGLIILTEPE